MPKVVINSSRNKLTADGLIDRLATSVDQAVLTTSDVVFNNVSATGDLIVQGDAQIKGSVTYIESNVLKIQDNIIEINDANEPLRLAGIQFNRGPTLPAFQLIYDSQDQLLKSGTVNEPMQQIARCSGNLDDQGICVWDAGQGSFSAQRVLDSPISFRTRLAALGGLAFEQDANTPSVLGDAMGNVIVNPRGDILLYGTRVKTASPVDFGSVTVQSTTTGVLSVTADEMAVSGALRLGIHSMASETSEGFLGLEAQAVVLLENTPLVVKESIISFGSSEQSSIAYHAVDDELVVSATHGVRVNAPYLNARELVVSDGSGQSGGLAMASDGVVSLTSSSGVIESDSDVKLSTGRKLTFADAPGSFVNTASDRIVIQGSRGILLSASDGVKVSGGGLFFNAARIAESPAGDLVVTTAQSGRVVMPGAQVQSITVGASARLIETVDGLVLSADGSVITAQPLKALGGLVFGNGSVTGTISRTIDGELIVRNAGKITLASSDQVNVGDKLSWGNGAAIVSDGSGLTVTSPGTVDCRAPLLKAIKLAAEEVASVTVTGDSGTFQNLNTERITVNHPIDTGGLRRTGTINITGGRVEIETMGASVPSVVVTDTDVTVYGNTFTSDGVEGLNASWQDLSCLTLSVTNCFEAAQDGGVSFTTPATLNEGFTVPNVLDVTATGLAVKGPIDSASYLHVHDTLAVDGTSAFQGEATFGGVVDMTGHRITNLGTPRNAGDAVSKRFLESIAMGFRVLQSVDVAASGPIDLTVAAPSMIDGYAVAQSQRVLLFGQANGRDNGVYVVGPNMMLTRSSDMLDPTVDVSGASVFVNHGTQYTGYGFVVTSGTARRTILPTQDVMIWTVFSGITQINASGGIVKTGNDIMMDLDPSSLTLSASGQVALSASGFGTGLQGGSGLPVSVAPLQPQITSLGTITHGTWEASPVDVLFGGTGNTEYTVGAILVGDGSQPLVATDSLAFRSFGSGRKGLSVGLLNTTPPQGELHVKSDTPTIYLDGSSTAGGIVFAAAGGTVGTVGSSTTELELDHTHGVTMRAGSAAYLRVTSDNGTIVHGGLSSDVATVQHLQTPLIELSADAAIAYSAMSGLSVHAAALRLDSDALTIGGISVTKSTQPTASITALDGRALNIADSTCPELTLGAGVVTVPGQLKLGPGTMLAGTADGGAIVQSTGGDLVVQTPLNVQGQIKMGALAWTPAGNNVILSAQSGGARFVVDARLSATSTSGASLLDLDPTGGGTLTMGDVSTQALRSSTLAITSCNAYSGGLSQTGSWYYVGRASDGLINMVVGSLGQFTIQAYVSVDPDVTFALEDAASPQRARVHVYRATDGTHDAHVFVYAITAPCGVNIVHSTHGIGPYHFEGSAQQPDGSASGFRSTWTEVFNSRDAMPNMAMAYGQLRTRSLSVQDAVVHGSMTCQAAATFTGPSVLWKPNDTGTFQLSTTSDGSFTQDLSTSTGSVAVNVKNTALQSSAGIILTSDGNGALVYGGSGSLSITTGGVSALTFSANSIALARPLIATQSVTATQVIADQIVSSEHKFSDALSLRMNGAGNLEIASSSSSSGGGVRLTGIAAPVDASDAVSKQYADNLSYGFTIFGPARLASTTNVDLAQNPPTFIDGSVTQVGDLILLPNQTDNTQRGLYQLTSFSSPLQRVPLGELHGRLPYFYVREGTVYGGNGLTVNYVNTFSVMHGPLQMVAGVGMAQVGNQVSIQLRAGSGLAISTDGLGIGSGAAGLGLTGGDGRPLTVSSIAHLDTLGTITRGVWNGAPVAVAYGGTGTNAFSSGSVPFSNGSRLVDGRLRFDATLQALGINTMQPTEGLTLADRNILIRRMGAASTSLQFASGSYADAFAYVFRESDNGMQWLCGPPTALQPYITVDRGGKVNMLSAVSCAALTVGNISLRGSSMTQAVAGPFNMRCFSATNEGCTTSWYGSLGQVDSIGDSEFMRAGYYNGSFALMTSATGLGIVRSLSLQAGANADQLLLKADGSIATNGSVTHFAPVSIVDTLDVTGTTTLANLVVNTDLSVAGRVSIGSHVITELNGSTINIASLDVSRISIGTHASSDTHQLAILAGSSIDSSLTLGYQSSAMTLAATGSQGALCLASPSASILLPSSSGAITMSSTQFTGPVGMQQGLNVAGTTSIALLAVAQAMHLADAVTLGPSPDGLCHLVQSLGGGQYIQLSGMATDALYLGVAAIGNPTGCAIRAPVGRTLSLFAGNTSIVLDTMAGTSTGQPLSLGSSLSVAGNASFAAQVTMAAGAKVSRISADSLQFTTADSATTLHYITPSLQRSMVPMVVDGAVNNVRALAVGSAFIVDTYNARIDCMGSKVQNVPDPVSPGDAVNKRYLDQYVSGIIVRASVVAASAASQNVDLTRVVSSLDGVTLNAGDRILLISQTNAVENGAYVITSQGYASRAPDMPINASAAKYYFFVVAGTTQAKLGYMCINTVGSDVVGSSQLAFTIYTSASPGTHSSPSDETASLQLATQSGLSITNGKLSISQSIAGQNVLFENGVLSVPMLTRDGVPVPIDEGGTGNTVLPAQGMLYSIGNQVESDPDSFRYDPLHKCMVVSSPSWSTSDTITCGGDVCLTGLNRYVYFADQQTSTYKWRVGSNSARDFVISCGDTQTKSSMQDVLRLDAHGTLTVSGSVVNATPFAIQNGGTGTNALQANGLVRVSNDGSSLISSALPPSSIVTGDAAGNFVALSVNAFKAFAGILPGRDVQAFSPLLQSIANMTGADNSFIVGRGGSYVEVQGATARDALGLGPFATAATIDNTSWSGQPLSVQNGGTGSSAHAPGAIIYSDAPSGKLKGSPALLWKPDVNTLTFGEEAAPAQFKILGGGSISLANNEDGDWTIGPHSVAGDLGIALISPLGEDVASFHSSGVILHQLQVMGNLSAGGAVDLASDVVVGGNLLVSAGVSAIGGFAVLDADDTSQKNIEWLWKGEDEGAYLKTAGSLTIDASKTQFGGGIETDSLIVHNPLSTSHVSMGSTSNAVTTIKRAALYKNGVSTLYLTVACDVPAPGPSSIEILLNDRDAPFGIDPLEEGTVLSSAYTQQGLPIMACARLVSNSRSLTVDWTNTLSASVIINLHVNC